eukprot:4277562-Prymnesium_polylepis.1
MDRPLLVRPEGLVIVRIVRVPPRAKYRASGWRIPHKENSGAHAVGRPPEVAREEHLPGIILHSLISYRLCTLQVQCVLAALSGDAVEQHAGDDRSLAPTRSAVCMLGGMMARVVLQRGPQEAVTVQPGVRRVDLARERPVASRRVVVAVVRCDDAPAQRAAAHRPTPSASSNLRTFMSNILNQRTSCRRALHGRDAP